MLKLVGVIPTLPVEGISLLLGNDLACDNVIMEPIVSDEPSYEENRIRTYRHFFYLCGN